jgi:hypothetical protein
MAPQQQLVKASSPSTLASGRSSIRTLARAGRADLCCDRSPEIETKIVNLKPDMASN